MARMKRKLRFVFKNVKNQKEIGALIQFKWKEMTFPLQATFYLKGNTKELSCK